MSTADIENNRCVLKPLIRKWLKSCTVKSTSECTIQLPDICRSYVACILLTLPTLFYIYAHIIAHILSMHSDIILPILPVCQSVMLWYRCSTKQYAQLLPSSIVQMHHSSFLSPNDATKRKTAHMRVKYTRGCDFRPKSSLSRKTIGPQLLSITNTKSQVADRSVSVSVTLSHCSHLYVHVAGRIFFRQIFVHSLVYCLTWNDQSPRDNTWGGARFQDL